MIIIFEVPEDEIDTIADGWLKSCPGPTKDDDSGDPLYKDRREQFKASVKEKLMLTVRTGLKCLDEQRAIDGMTKTEIPNSLLEK